MEFINSEKSLIVNYLSQPIATIKNAQATRFFHYQHIELGKAIVYEVCYNDGDTVFYLYLNPQEFTLFPYRSQEIQVASLTETYDRCFYLTGNLQICEERQVPQLFKLFLQGRLVLGFSGVFRYNYPQDNTHILEDEENYKVSLTTYSGFFNGTSVLTWDTWLHQQTTIQIFLTLEIGCALINYLKMTSRIERARLHNWLEEATFNLPPVNPENFDNLLDALNENFEKSLEEKWTSVFD